MHDDKKVGIFCIVMRKQTIIKIPFKIRIPDYLGVPEEIKLLPDRFMPRRIQLPPGLILPEVEFSKEDIPRQSIFWIDWQNSLEAIDVRIFPQTIEKNEQFVEFKLSPDVDTSELMGHCLLPTNTLPHGSVEDWGFREANQEKQTIRLIVPTALYWEYIMPHYYQDFWQGLACHLMYLDAGKWWGTW